MSSQRRLVSVLHRITGLLVVALLPACGESTLAHASEAPASTRGALTTQAIDIRAQLESIPGLTILRDQQLNATARYFVMDFEQPADHGNPGGERFLQRLSLVHRSTEAPMVLGTEGYDLNEARVFQGELGFLLTSNVLRVEHRFFDTSRPASGDWRLLTIEQAAADHHRVVQAFKPVYRARWVSTGVSKGGMAAIYHRFFYPDDVDATVPYVAPNSQGLADERYMRFLETVGDEACRDGLKALQESALRRREELLPLMDTLGSRFDTLGTERAFEFAVLEWSYYFWQYYGPLWTCDSLPSPDAPAGELFDFLSLVASPDFNFGDEAMEFYAPYFYQAATQLGAPRYPEAHLRPLLRYPGQDVVTNFPPLGVDKRFDVTAMLEVAKWMRKDARRMLPVYGELDPWSTGAFEVDAANDSFRVFVPGASHFASLFDMPEPERSRATAKLAEWMGVRVRPFPSAAARGAPFAEDAWDVPALSPEQARRPRL